MKTELGLLAGEYDVTPTGRLSFPKTIEGEAREVPQVAALDGAARSLLAVIDTQLKTSVLTPEQQMAVALNAAVMACSRLPGVSSVRGKIINAACEEFRKRLQAFLPR